MDKWLKFKLDKGLKLGEALTFARVDGSYPPIAKTPLPFNLLKKFPDPCPKSMDPISLP